LSPISSHISWNIGGTSTSVLYLQGKNYISSTPLRETQPEIRIIPSPMMSKVLTGQNIRESLVQKLLIMRERISKSHNLPDENLSVKKHILV
jgi:hypothetical protein